MHEVRPLLEELEQISVELERDEKWDKCCFVSHNLYDLYVKAEPHNLWTHQLIMTSKKRMVLRMARCTYQTKDFASVNRNCKFVLEQLCEYDCVEALMLWAKSLWKTKKYDVALKKANIALECCKERERVEEARCRYRKKIKRCKSKRIENTYNQEDNIPQTSETLTMKTTQSSHSTVLKTDLLYERTRSPSSIPLSETILDGSSTSNDNDTDASNHPASLSAWTSPVKIGRKRQKRKCRNLSGINTKILGNIVTWTGSIISKQRSLSLNIENLEDLYWSELDDDMNHSSISIDSSNYEDKAKTDFRDNTNINDDKVSYFERSRMFFNKQNDNSTKEELNMAKMLQTGLELDEDFLKKFTSKPQRPPFYEKELSEGELQKRIKEQPNRYKKCYFQIKFVHLAYCTPVDQNDDIKKIEISGRSKAGQALSDDIVWVEILDKEYLSTQEAKVFGKVVKIIKRNRKENTKHPVYACTIDNLESHLMKPICNTLPKIHVLNQTILSKCPELKKYKVELHKYDPVSKKLEFERLINIPPEKRNSFVFLVVYMGWTRHHVYPRGAVIKVLLCADDLDSSNDLDSGIKLLDIQYEVPGLYSSQTVKHIESIMSGHVDTEPTEALRVCQEDLISTSLRVFTIDPPGSKDLDDALSIEKIGNGYQVGVHISDVTAFVQKGDPVDTEAQQRVTTFYSGVRSPHHMIPEPLSQNLCSLLPGKCRRCISVLFNMTNDGRVVGQPSIKKTVIKSSKRFTYEEVQDIINKTSTEVDRGIREDIDKLFRLAILMRKTRLGNSMYALKVELGDETDKDKLSKTLEAHYLVEEFMILANKTVAEILIKEFPDLVPLRCQNPPPNGESQNWLKKQGEIVDLLLCLQDRDILNDKSKKRPSIESINGSNSQLLIPVQENIFQILHSMPSPKAIKCMKTDGLHPLQYLAHQEWLQIQEYTDYRCSGSLKNISTEGKHFRLEMCRYTHFTSPIRRYVDQIVHRLLHCFIDGKEATYTQKEVEELCVRINTVTQRAKAYQKHCTSLTFAVKLKQKPTMFYCYVSNVTDRSLHLCTPALRFVHYIHRELPFNLLNISTKQALKQDTKTNRDIVTVEWQKCLYEVGVSSTITRHISTIDPNQHVVYVPCKDWVHALQSALRENADGVFETFRNITPALSWLPSSHDADEDASTETNGSTMKAPHSKFSTTFAYGQVIKVQMMAAVQKGILAPCLQLYDMTKNVICCLQHVEDPVKCLCFYSTKPTLERYPDVKQYLYRWLPLVIMEAATSSIHNEEGFTICNLPVTFSERTGHFRLQTAFCFERNIEISGHGAYELAEKNDDTCENESQEENDSASHGWLCIRHKEPEKQESLTPSSVWVVHGQIKKVEKITQQDEVSVHFEICDLSTVSDDNKKECTVEFLIKLDVDRRTEIYLKSLKAASDLAKKIALNRKIPKLGTGKSYTGIKLLYLFNKINKQWEKKGNLRKQVLFCGPSNNSVDQIARWMKNRLEKHCPSIVRMYGRSIEATDFPIRGKAFQSKQSMHGSKAAKDLKHISLHHLIREKSKPFAEEINTFDESFKLPDYIPDHKEVQKYVHLLKVATVEELKKHDVILCTTAVASNKLLKGTDIYQIIIDEAAMCTEPQCLVPIIATKAEQVVLIGDHKQLQPIIMCKEAAELGLEKSLFERYAESQCCDKNNIQYTLLEIQYRMHPRICDFPSQEFYDNKLITEYQVNYWKEGYKRKGQWISRPLKMWPHKNYTHVFCHIVGQEEVLTVSTKEGNEYSRSNMEEVKQVVKVFSHMVNSEKVKSNQICVISQYNAQCHKLRNELSTQRFQCLNVNTVVGSQGGEWDYVIFSTVRSLPEFMIEHNPTFGWCKQNLGFITDHHQINVALTRAKKGIIIVGNQNLLQCDEVWKRLIYLYKQRGCIKTAEEFP
ncbi:hypothetical protein ACJMK2_041307 [Sinanodonta woodiana]|uniref:RNB domain-containing protein n=1 Tax=Sinanodonta woodiana TaxID=1069815 RepID=A0ABD3W3Q2_SINWO